jgi:hypothetical protein
MAVQTQFPGMNPYLEHPNRWPEVQRGFIHNLQRSLNHQITPTYRAVVRGIETRDYFLDVVVPGSDRVVTTIEVLLSEHKQSGKGRSLYLEKRRKILESSSHFVEIDLLREGESMPLNSQNLTDYQVLVSRAEDRPMADRYGFNLRDSMPCFTLPLDSEEVEPVIELKALMEQTYQEAALDLSIDYSQQPVPEVTAADWDWMRSL